MQWVMIVIFCEVLIGPVIRQVLEPLGPRVGTVAPEFTLPDLASGNPVSLAKLRSKNKPVVLIFGSFT